MHLLEGLKQGLRFSFAEFRLAVVQLQVSSVKADNLSRARTLVKEAAGQGSKLVLLPVSARLYGSQLKLPVCRPGSKYNLDGCGRKLKLTMSK